MCPLRLILVFLSVSVAGFLAWKAMGSKDTEVSEQGEYQHQRNVEDRIPTEKGFSIRLAFQKIVLAFRILADMTSGKYLWRNLVNSGDSRKVKAL